MILTDGKMNNIRQRLTIRISNNSLSFSAIDADEDRENPIVFEPYVVKSGISMAANLRTAFEESDLLSMGYTKARILVDAPVLLTPVELFDEQQTAQLYYHAYPRNEQNTILYNVLPDLNAVAIFAINRDLKVVIDDHFRDVQFISAMTPVWRHLHQRSFTGVRAKLYGYFHDQKLEIFSFQQNRFKFYNQFEVKREHDAVYFLLYVWKQLMMDAEGDEMHLVGSIPEQEWLTTELKKYIQKAYVINPSADFNRAPATQIKNMPYDLMTLFTKGR